MTLREKINAFDGYFEGRRPSDVDGGRIIYAKTPAELFTRYEPKKERIATPEEIVLMRIHAIQDLWTAVPELLHAANIIEGSIPEYEFTEGLADIRINVLPDLSSPEFQEMLSSARDKALRELDKDTYAIWKIRPTTSGHMVRATTDEIFFYNGNPFESEKELIAALSGELSDGGLEYGTNAIEKIMTGSNKMPNEEYLEEIGGNLTGTEFLDHKIVSKAIGNEDLFEKYVYCLQVMNLLDSYHQGLHSAWRPGEMKEGFGRLIALGYKGDTFYPPNNSTIDHAALVINSTHN